TREHDHGATVVGLCLGTFPLAEAGLLTGRRVVTHLHAFDLLAELHPSLSVDETVLYIDDGDVITSAGTASGLDACLHIVSTQLGASARKRTARCLVVGTQRDGGQAQYIQSPLADGADDAPIADVLVWALNRLVEPLPVHRLAAAGHMRSRAVVRAFRRSTG